MKVESLGTVLCSVQLPYKEMKTNINIIIQIIMNYIKKVKCIFDICKHFIREISLNMFRTRYLRGRNSLREATQNC